MPYPYTPSPAYTTPVQLASDGDPASSATIMGPIEAALDNIAAVYELGPKTIRHVPDLAALVALTGVAHNEVALVASDAGEGYPGTSYGLWRYVLGGSADAPTVWERNSTDGLGVWMWVDYARVGTASGLAILTSLREISIASGASTADAIRVGLAGELQISGGGTALVSDDGTIMLDRTGGDPAEGGTLEVMCGGGAFDAGVGLQILSGGGAHVQSGGLARVHSGGTLQADSGSIVTLDGSAYVTGTLEIATGGALELKERVRHEVLRYANAALSGTPIAVTAATADEHILGGTPAAPTTFTLADPTASGQRVRFSRDVITPTTTVLTLTASGASYSISGTNGHLRWLELTSALNGSLTLVWYPSAYALH